MHIFTDEVSAVLSARREELPADGELRRRGRGALRGAAGHVPADGGGRIRRMSRSQDAVSTLPDCLSELHAV